MHASTKEFLDKAFENSKKVFDGGLQDGIYVSKEDGYTVLADNYERFFAEEWKVTDDGVWSVRANFDAEWREYTQEQAMQDADILYTG